MRSKRAQILDLSHFIKIIKEDRNNMAAEISKKETGISNENRMITSYREMKSTSGNSGTRKMCQSIIIIMTKMKTLSGTKTSPRKSSNWAE